MQTVHLNHTARFLFMYIAFFQDKCYQVKYIHYHIFSFLRIQIFNAHRQCCIDIADIMIGCYHIPIQNPVDEDRITQNSPS